MNVLMAAAAEQRKRSAWADKVVFNLEITPTGIRNKINGDAGTLPANGASLSQDFVAAGQARSVRLTASAQGGLTFPDRADYALGTGDFTAEILMKVDSVPVQPVDNSQIIPLAYWGTYAAAGTTTNFEMFYNEKNGAMIGGALRPGTAQEVSVGAGSAVINKTRLVHMAMVRKKGIVTMYRDKVKIGSVAYAGDISRAVAGQLFRIGSRRGGASPGTVWWVVNGVISGFRLTKYAIYEGDTIGSPAGF